LRRDARAVSERGAGVFIGPVSHAGNRAGCRPSRCLARALDRGYTAVEMMHHDGSFFTSEGHVAPSVFGDMSSMILSPGDVIVMSGGATGISAHWRAVSRHSCLAWSSWGERLWFQASIWPSRTPGICLLKRSPPIPRHRRSPRTKAYSPRICESVHCPTSRHRRLRGPWPICTPQGSRATYHTCDVTDPDAVRAVMGEVVSRYGRIDGIIHGAGVLRMVSLAR